MSLNDRVFVRNDPVNWVDPWGLDPGDLFGSQDEAAIDALDYSMPVSLAAKKEYAGFIYKTSDGQYSYVEPVQGDENHSYPDKFNKPPCKTKPTAMYHTHPSNRRRDDLFSGDDYYEAGVGMRMDIYMGRPSGLIRVVGPKTKEHKIRRGW